MAIEKTKPLLQAKWWDSQQRIEDAAREIPVYEELSTEARCPVGLWVSILGDLQNLAEEALSKLI